MASRIPHSPYIIITDQTSRLSVCQDPYMILGFEGVLLNVGGSSNL